MTANPFTAIWSLGYERLVPIIPPDAELSATSSLAKRKDARGKAVGVRGSAGQWYGFDWIPYESDEDDCLRWHRMGAGCGVKTGRGLIAVDADTLDLKHAEIIRDIIRDQLGDDLPIRVGNYPKALYLCRVTDDYRYTRVEFGHRREDGSLKDRVEILSDGRQFVAYGIHPTTRKPYSWPQALIPYADLPSFEPAQIDALMAALQAALPSAPAIIREGADASDVNQDALRGKYETVKKAVESTPNSSEHFPTREKYRDYGYAIKAALPDDEPAAYDLFLDWCLRWKEGANDPDIVAADWRRMKGPFKRGAGWLYELAEKYSGGKFTEAEAWFEPIPDDDNPFAEIRRQELTEQKVDPVAEAAAMIKASPYAFPDPKLITPRQWIYGNHYIRKFVSATVAPSGVGKSSLETIEALAMVSGKPLLGIEPKGQFRVWLWNGEDPRDELERKVAAGMLHYGLTEADLGDRLFLDSGRNMEIIMATEGKDGARIAVPVVEAVKATILANRIDVLQIDPFVSSHRVSENDNGAIDMVSKQWARIADNCNCAIELVHHVRKLNGAEITVEDSRGAVSLIATSRSARALTKMSAREGTLLGIENHWRYFRFGDGKNNLAPPASAMDEWMELKSVGLGNGPVGVDAGEAAGSVMNEWKASAGGDWIGVVCRFDVGSAVRVEDEGGLGEALRLIGGGEWRRDIRAGDAWVGVPLGRALGIDYTDDDGKGRLKHIIATYIKQGVLVEVTRKDAQRRQRTYVEAGFLEDKLSVDVFG